MFRTQKVDELIFGSPFPYKLRVNAEGTCGSVQRSGRAALELRN
jgi:hypothetical protein